MSFPCETIILISACKRLSVFHLNSFQLLIAFDCFHNEDSASVRYGHMLLARDINIPT